MDCLALGRWRPKRRVRELKSPSGPSRPGRLLLPDELAVHVDVPVLVDELRLFGDCALGRVSSSRSSTESAFGMSLSRRRGNRRTDRGTASPLLRGSHPRAPASALQAASQRHRRPAPASPGSPPGPHLSASFSWLRATRTAQSQTAVLLGTRTDTPADELPVAQAGRLACDCLDVRPGRPRRRSPEQPRPLRIPMGWSRDWGGGTHIVDGERSTVARPQ